MDASDGGRPFQPATPCESEPVPCAARLLDDPQDGLGYSVSTRSVVGRLRLRCAHVVVWGQAHQRRWRPGSSKVLSLLRHAMCGHRPRGVVCPGLVCSDLSSARSAAEGDHTISPAAGATNACRARSISAVILTTVVPHAAGSVTDSEAHTRTTPSAHYDKNSPLWGNQNAFLVTFVARTKVTRRLRRRNSSARQER